LIYAAKALENLKGDNDDENTGINIIKKAITLPCSIIAKNAGYESFSVVEKIKASTDNTYGFDAYKGTFVNMIEKGIIDPTKVVRIALVDASSVAALMTSTECMIVDAKEDKKEGGMGGMDY
jgi:chaperonin GroEL